MFEIHAIDKDQIIETMNLEQRRSNIENSTANTAQSIFEQHWNLVENKDGLIRFVVPTELRGSLDLGILKTSTVSELVFLPGELTTLTNLPTQIKVLQVPNNLLITLPVISPSKIESLDVQGNSLRDLDVSSWNKLETLQVSRNQLRSLKIPRSLVSLEAVDNKLTTLDLSGLKKLQKLHVQDNLGLVLKNMPSKSIEDLKIDNPDFQHVLTELNNAPSTSTLTKGGGKGMDDQGHIASPMDENYIDALNHYFQLKQSYEDKRKEDLYTFVVQKKRKRSDFQPICIQCKRIGGTVFEQTDQHYTAKCGVKKEGGPCSLSLSVGRSYSESVYKQMATYQAQVMEQQNSTIKLKMETVLAIHPTTNLANRVDDLLQEYKSTVDIFEMVRGRYREVVEQSTLQEEIQQKQKELRKTTEEWLLLLDQYRKTKEDSILKDIVKKEIDLLFPQHSWLAHRLHMTMEMTEENNRSQYRLVQYPFAIRDYTS